MTENNEWGAPFAHAEIFIQKPALILIRLFNGQEREVDISRYHFQGVTEAAEFLVTMFSAGMQDSMILSGLRPRRPAKPEIQKREAHE